MKLPAKARAAILAEPGADLRIVEYPLPAVPENGVLVKVRCCTICRSDLHSITGRRPSPMPVILGHEIIGEIAALGSSVKWDCADQPLHIGDRITWTLHSSCGTCYHCSTLKLPMKCRSLKKYGHDASDRPPHFLGGFAEFCLLDGGTRLLKVPDELPDLIAAPANCAVATIVAGWDAAELKAGESVLIQGAGALGCYASAFAAYSGCANVIVTDVDPRRLELIRAFGATATINVADLSVQALVEQVKELTGGHGVGCAMEVAGEPAIIPAGLACLQKGGRYIEIGCSFPAANVTLDMSTILWNLLTIKGVHNYDTPHLKSAVDFLSATRSRFPFEKLSTASYRLDEINQAVAHAQRRDSIRVAVVF